MSITTGNGYGGYQEINFIIKPKTTDENQNNNVDNGSQNETTTQGEKRELNVTVELTYDQMMAFFAQQNIKFVSMANAEPKAIVGSSEGATEAEKAEVDTPKEDTALPGLDGNLLTDALSDDLAKAISAEVSKFIQNIFTIIKSFIADTFAKVFGQIGQMLPDGFNIFDTTALPTDSTGPPIVADDTSDDTTDDTTVDDTSDDTTVDDTTDDTTVDDTTDDTTDDTSDDTADDTADDTSDDTTDDTSDDTSDDTADDTADDTTQPQQNSTRTVLPPGDVHRVYLDDDGNTVIVPNGGKPNLPPLKEDVYKTEEEVQADIDAAGGYHRYLAQDDTPHILVESDEVQRAYMGDNGEVITEPVTQTGGKPNLPPLKETQTTTPSTQPKAGIPISSPSMAYLDDNDNVVVVEPTPTGGKPNLPPLTKPSETPTLPEKEPTGEYTFVRGDTSGRFGGGGGGKFMVDQMD